jgi:hypothetical protein
VFDHVGIHNADLAAAERFYRTVLSVLGAGRRGYPRDPLDRAAGGRRQHQVEPQPTAS